MFQWFIDTHTHTHRKILCTYTILQHTYIPGACMGSKSFIHTYTYTYTHTVSIYISMAYIHTRGIHGLEVLHGMHRGLPSSLCTVFLRIKRLTFHGCGGMLSAHHLGCFCFAADRRVVDRLCVCVCVCVCVCIHVCIAWNALRASSQVLRLCR
jgi:hypothetical protein